MSHLDDPGAFLISEGFRARRFGGLVYIIRRALWPFMRSFFLATASMVRETASMAHAADDRTRTVEASLTARLLTLEAKHDSTLAEMYKFSRPFLEFKAESAAIYNRYLILERLVRDAAATHQRLADHVAIVNTRLDQSLTAIAETVRPVGKS